LRIYKDWRCGANGRVPALEALKPTGTAHLKKERKKERNSENKEELVRIMDA
jgi:hypothetical protein